MYHDVCVSDYLPVPFAWHFKLRATGGEMSLYTVRLSGHGAPTMPIQPEHDQGALSPPSLPGHVDRASLCCMPFHVYLGLLVLRCLACTPIRSMRWCPPMNFVYMLNSSNYRQARGQTHARRKNVCDINARARFPGAWSGFNLSGLKSMGDKNVEIEFFRENAGLPLRRCHLSRVFVRAFPGTQEWMDLAVQVASPMMFTL